MGTLKKDISWIDYRALVRIGLPAVQFLPQVKLGKTTCGGMSIDCWFGLIFWKQLQANNFLGEGVHKLQLAAWSYWILCLLYMLLLLK